MDEIDQKFEEMQKYIPFLENMIEVLQNIKDKNIREEQVRKMKGLHGILLSKQKYVGRKFVWDYFSTNTNSNITLIL